MDPGHDTPKPGSPPTQSEGPAPASEPVQTAASVSLDRPVKPEVEAPRPGPRAVIGGPTPITPAEYELRVDVLKSSLASALTLAEIGLVPSAEHQKVWKEILAHWPNVAAPPAPVVNKETLPFQPDLTIKVGDRVKSYDFPDLLTWDPERAEECFVEGVVQVITSMEGCDRYGIAVDRRVLGGEDRWPGDQKWVYPPVNGVPTLTGGVTFAVVKLPTQS